IEDKRVAESSIKTSWFEGMEKGKTEGRIEGKVEGKREIAIEMIKEGEPIDKIRKYTDLTEEEIDQLKDSLTSR
ncbi:MAG: hypothetical protein HQK65_23895, partial [Desulfamplus sp.]|nr:hypothetical protein [Desulfamplus sp.]